jgi:hypothetical protein
MSPTKEISPQAKFTIWTMLACQMGVWAWSQINGGQLADVPYLWFSLGMLTGQAGGTIECYRKRAWGTMVVQIYFFVFTAIGGFVRFSQMR